MPIRLFFTDHAKVRILERRYQIEHIKKAIRAPDRLHRQGGGKVKVRKRLEDGWIITMIYRAMGPYRPSEYLIITSYYN